MTEVFRERIAESEAPVSVSAPVELVNDPLKGNETKVLNDLTPDEKNIVVWEGEHNKKFVNEYFNTHNTAHEFMVKMPTSEIDKFVKSEITSRKMEFTIDNYKHVLAEIENEIGSNRMELFQRFHKLTGYIKAINRLNRAKELKESYSSSMNT